MFTHMNQIPIIADLPIPKTTKWEKMLNRRFVFQCLVHICFRVQIIEKIHHKVIYDIRFITFSQTIHVDRLIRKNKTKPLKKRMYVCKHQRHRYASRQQFQLLVYIMSSVKATHMTLTSIYEHQTMFLKRCLNVGKKVEGSCSEVAYTLYLRVHPRICLVARWIGQHAKKK